MARNIYQPRLEVANEKESKVAWQDWGQFDRMSEAVRVAEALMKEIDEGRYDDRISDAERGAGFRLNACVEVLDADSFELLYIEEIDGPEEKPEEKASLFTAPAPKGASPYAFADLVGCHRAKGLDAGKPIIVEVGGERVPLTHCYVVTKEIAEEQGLPDRSVGCMVLDLDV